jgi:hypothetical protein
MKSTGFLDFRAKTPHNHRSEYVFGVGQKFFLVGHENYNHRSEGIFVGQKLFGPFWPTALKTGPPTRNVTDVTKVKLSV